MAPRRIRGRRAQVPERVQRPTQVRKRSQKSAFRSVPRWRLRPFRRTRVLPARPALRPLDVTPLPQPLVPQREVLPGKLQRSAPALVRRTPPEPPQQNLPRPPLPQIPRHGDPHVVKNRVRGTRRCRAPWSQLRPRRLRLLTIGKRSRRRSAHPRTHYWQQEDRRNFGRRSSFHRSVGSVPIATQQEAVRRQQKRPPANQTVKDV